MRSPTLLTAAITSLLAVGCVSQGKYDRDIAGAHKVNSELQERVSLGRTDNAELQKQLDQSTAIQSQLREELGRLGKDADALLKDKGALAQSLEQARARLEELRKARAAAEQRAALFRELALKLKSQVDAGELKIVLRDGRMVLQLPNDVLFDSGHTVLKPNGKEALKSVANVLKTLSNRHFQVSGHTDSVPIRTDRFPSNWELSSARALEVVHFMVAQGVDPQWLSAAGYGEFDPVAANDSPTGKQANRRTEISVIPNIDELVAVPPIQ